MCTRTLAARRGREGALHVASVAGLLVGLLGCSIPSGPPPESEDRDRGRIAALGLPGPPQRVIVISVAGLQASDFLTPDGFVSADGQGVRMPRLSQLASEGVVGERALPPSPGSSYASHASIVTGRLPPRHGIVGDERLGDDGDQTEPFWDSRLLRGEALWDAAIGRGVMALGWPTTIGARIELVLPDARPTEKGESWLDLMRRIATPALVRDLEEIADDALPDTNRDGEPDRDPTTWPTPAEKDAALAELACNVALSDRDPGLWLIALGQSSAALLGRGVGSVELASALGRIDEEIGLIVDCLSETEQLADTAIFVVGDAAYRPVHTRFDPNVSLVREGLIGRDPRASTGVRSWLAIALSHGRSAYVYAKDAGNAVVAREILEEEARRSRAFRVVPASDLAKAGIDPQAWFGLAAEPGYMLGGGLTRPDLRPSAVRASPGSLRLPDVEADAVGFVAWGRGIRSPLRVPRLELVDVAPTIGMLLGLRFQDRLDGRALIGILRAAVPPPPPGPKRLGVDSDGDVDRSLRDLGGGR